MNANLQKAIDNLQIEDVYLRKGTLFCADGFEPKYTQEIESLEVQSKHNVIQSQIVKLEDERQLVRVYIELGSRWLKKAEESSEPFICAVIEADYVAEYVIKSELEKECIDEFALHNASYHVWPYWREFLASSCERLRLPRIVLPTRQLAHNRHQGSSKDE